VLATIACGVPSGSSLPAPARSVLPTGIGTATTTGPPERSGLVLSVATVGVLQLGPTVDLPALGRGTRSVAVVGSSTFWITDDRAAPEHSVIVTSEALAQPKILFTPQRVGAHFQLLTVGPEWMAWIEHVENQTWKDARIYVARRGGQPILIDDMAKRGELVTFPELALDGADLYWTIPQDISGVWHGLLLHRDLNAETMDTIEAGDDTIFTWPAATHGVVAYEVTKHQPNAEMFVRYRDAGRVTDLAGASSEPAVGAGYLLFKRGNRYSPGTVESVGLSGQKQFRFGRGEGPRSDGSLAVWFDSNANEGLVARPGDGCKAISTMNRARSDGTALLSAAVGGMRLAWSGLANNNGTISEFIRTATIERLAC
jgi:hypothetical protein